MAMVDALGYVVVEATDIGAWRHYAEQVLGMATSEAPGSGLYLKMDEHEFRIAVFPGETDRYYASGWAASDRAALDAAVAALREAGVSVEEADADSKALRQAEQVVRFTDPSGNLHELACGFTSGRSPFASPIGVSGFKTGEYGLGHTVLPAAEAFEDTLALFRDALGFGVSDEFDFQMDAESPVTRIRFLHCNGRHHSLALAEMPNPAGCVHLMVEVESMTEVGEAYDRMAANDVKLMATLGEHVNDRMTSFYMLTPGNFALEYGWGGKIVDPATHETTRSTEVSRWGHDFSVGFQ